MSHVSILTDNVAQIPHDMAEKNQIDVINFSINIEGKSYKDGIDIFPKDIYERMRTDDISPQTSQPSLGEYQEFFETQFKKGAQTILYIAVSSTLSGAFSTACSAAHLVEQEYPGKKIVVFDSNTATIAQGFVALEVARAAHNGADLERLIQIAEGVKPKVGFAALLETLKYLARGGRVGKAAYLVGNMINIRPIITIDLEGEIAPLGNLRGNNNVLPKLVERTAVHIGDQAPIRIAVMHSDSLENAEQLRQLAQDHFNLEDVFITDFTPVMGAHLGPGVLGLGFQLE